MYNYNYRVYGYIEGRGYMLVDKTNILHKAREYTNKKEYDKVLIIRHNIDLNMDEPIILDFPSERKVRTRR